MALRKIVTIDEEKCNGCGACIPSCAEGALQIIDGKARLVKEIYCDGLGACLGECPEDAITIKERETAAFDEAATLKHLEELKRKERKKAVAEHPAGCPGSRMMSMLDKKSAESTAEGETAEVPSELSNWPVQLMLAPVNAPFFEDADLLLSADCVPFAYGSFHKRYLRGKPLLVGCPKLDDAQVYIEKLGAIISENNLKSINVIHMEVPCCLGLVYILEEALKLSGKKVPVKDTTISISGEVKEERELKESDAA